MTHNGSAIITFGVERYNPDGELEEILLTITGKSYYTPAKTYGEPEDCYPEEGETEIISIMRGKEVWNGELTSDETERVEEEIREEVSSCDGGIDYEPDYYEDD